MSTKAIGRERFEFQFGRRCRAAEEGRHFPSYLELLLGMPFFGNSIQDDVDEFVRRTLPSVEDDTLVWPLREMLVALTRDPSIDMSRAAAGFCRSETVTCGRDYDGWAARLEFYAAAWGCSDSAVQTALEAISLSNNEVHRLNGCSSTLIRQALGWLATVDEHFASPGERVCSVGETGEALVSRIIAERIPADGDGGAEYLPRWAGLPSDPSSLPRAEQPGDASSDRCRAVIVFAEVGNRGTQEGKRVESEWRSLIGRPLSLVPIPDLVAVRGALLAEFPFASEVIDTVLAELPGRTHVTLRPTVLVGEPGIGKTRFAEALLRRLRVPVGTYPCGGVSDSSLAGTSRRWTSGEPSLVTSLIRQHACASPGIVLDEIEKVGLSRNNGNLLDALLAFLEPQTAAAWMDPYLEAPVDLSHVIWLGTANDVSELPAPLRDRCRILRFPSPGPEHLPALASHLLEQAIRERGLDTRWALPLSGEELDCLRRVWTGGSLRRLRRLVEGVIAVRESDLTLQ